MKKFVAGDLIVSGDRLKLVLGYRTHRNVTYVVINWKPSRVINIVVELSQDYVDKHYEKA